MRRQSNNRKGGTETPAKETDPLLEASAPSYLRSTQGSSTRSRKSRSPHSMNHSEPADGDYDPYHIVRDSNAHNPWNDTSAGGSSHYTPGSRSVHSVKQSPVEGGGSDKDNGPLLQIPDHVYAVRKGALSVLKPLTKTWVRNIYSITMTLMFGIMMLTHSYVVH